jgi:adhesin transport system membrane fusion protein
VGLQDRLDRTEVRAPMSGVVKQLMVSTVGGVIQPGMDLMEIVPEEDQLVIEARVRPADIAFLRVGQAATVKLSAFDFSIYGGFPARVEHISADTIAREQPDRRVLSYYLVRVRTESDRLKGWDGPVPILPGMEATVDIQTGRRTVLDYLMKPIIKTRERALRER